MTVVRPLDPSEPLALGRTIIEASAGTGKTFAIAATVARLVAAEGIPIDRILVVTFTRAATAELKDRVRRRLVLTMQALAGETDEDDDHLRFIRGLGADDRRAARRRLKAALSDFDTAEISTIHGFAQRLLGHLGLRVRLPETLEPGEIDDLSLRRVSSDVVVARYASGDDGVGVVTPPDAARIAREIIGHPDARVVPAPDEVGGLAKARVEVGTGVAAEARRRMRRTGALTFDDGLIEVRDALADPYIGAEATEMLRSRYDIGLIDESQDTDPIQWQILRRVFDGSRLVVIGDPKQSIYSFRGADIEAYLSAAEGAATHRTLSVNWRSDGRLVQALDFLFQNATFGDERIAYREVEAAQPSSRITRLGAPFHLRLVSSDLPIDRHRNGPFYRVGAARKAIAGDVAAEIVRLLGSGATIGEDNKPINPADIAVLCRTRAQIDEVRRELTARRVPSVASRTGSVLVTEAAEQWRRFLRALDRPDRLDWVRLAASTVLVGRPPAAVAALDDDEVLDLQMRLREWHDILAAGGVPALLSDLDRHTGLTARVLGLSDGERLLTDLTHIAEEMHAVFRRGRHGSLASWLEAAMQEAEARDERNVEEAESRQRRLETDADAVVVQTIHGVKGLQFPVVLVPYAWDFWIGTPEIPVFHQAQDGGGDEPRRRLIDVAGSESPDYDEHCRLAQEEDVAEESRLLYVALTRAKHHLVVWWVENHKDIANAKLTELLTREGHTPASLAAASGGLIDTSMMETLAGDSPYRPPASERPQLERARFERDTDQTWRRVSFSSLSADQPLTAAEETTEHALRSDEGDGPDEEATPPAPSILLPMADLPAGARFGTLVHDIMENLRFDHPDVEEEARVLIEREMRASGWDFDPAALASGLAAVITTPLGPAVDDPTLGQLETAGLARELVFELPIRTDRPAIALTDIGAVMDRHLPHDDPYRSFIGDLLDSPTPPFRGFMAGAIDLLATMPDGRFVVMDYKSNLLPALGTDPAPTDYGPTPLSTEMVSHRYALQATLYQVALHRYLQWRLPGYEPHRHLGGSLYLFIRGMLGTDTPLVDGERSGVTRWRPPPEMVVALSELFAGEPA